MKFLSDFLMSDVLANVRSRTSEVRNLMSVKNKKSAIVKSAISNLIGGA